MKDIKFEKEDSKNYEVRIYKADNKLDWEAYGKLEWDDEQDAWVLWPSDIDDGVTYFDDLKDTEEAIKDEIENNYEAIKMQQEITTRTWRKVLEEASDPYDSDVEYQGKQYTTFYADDTLDGDYPCAYVFSQDPQDDKLYKVDYEWTGDKDADEPADWVDDWTTDVRSIEQITDDVDDTVEFLNDNIFWKQGAVYY